MGTTKPQPPLLQRTLQADRPWRLGLRGACHPRRFAGRLPLLRRATARTLSLNAGLGSLLIPNAQTLVGQRALGGGAIRQSPADGLTTDTVAFQSVVGLRRGAPAPAYRPDLKLRQEKTRLSGFLSYSQAAQPFCILRIRKLIALARSAEPWWSRRTVIHGLPSAGLLSTQVMPLVGQL